MFDTIRQKSHRCLDDQIDRIKNYCDTDPAVAELVKYLIAYSNEESYASSGSTDSQIGRELSMFIWQISNADLSGIGCRDVDPAWASNLNYFIGNWIYDDSAFAFKQRAKTGVFEFKGANDDDDQWLQDPCILVEAAKANREYYTRLESMRQGRGYTDMSKDELNEFLNLRVNDTKVLELLNG